MKLSKHIFLSLVIIISLSAVSCKEKKEPVNEKIYGTWQIRMANVYSVYNFRANGSWTSSERVEGRQSKIVESRGKVVGQWTLAADAEEEGILWLTMTPTIVEEIDGWSVETPVKLKVFGIDDANLDMQIESGRKITWKRVRSKKAAEAALAEADAKVKVWPLIVNIIRKKKNSDLRFLCLDMDLFINNPAGSPYLAAEKLPDSEEITWHLHPKVRDVIIMYFSSFTYKELKTLEKVHETVQHLKLILNPYFNGNLNEINVGKVIVTTNRESVKEFETMYEIIAVNDGETEEEKSE